MVTPSSSNADQMLAPADMGKVIAKIIERHSTKLLGDRRRLLGLLRDYVPGELRGVKLLMASFDQNTPQGFLEQGTAPSKISIEQQANALVTNTGLQKELALWATEAWSAGLYAKSTPMPAPVADDLTWGSEAVSVNAAIPIAPSVASPATAPQVAVAGAPQAAAFQASASAAASKKPMDKFLVGCIVITALIGAFGVYYNTTKRTQLTQDTPQTPPENPATPPAGPGRQPAGDPVQADGTPWLITSTADDPTQWPLFNGASHPNNAARDWEFSFNSRLSDGRLAVYAVKVSLNSDMKNGTGYIRGLDLAVPDTNKMSVSPTVNAVRDFNATSKTYITTISSPTWQTNQTSIPPICVSFSSGGNLKRFQPESGIFCVDEWSNGSCSVSIGCGHVN